MTTIIKVSIPLMMNVIIEVAARPCYRLAMRITEEARLENRTRILDAAARLFRERGFNGVGVAEIMQDAGFTHGGFYNHFKSKEELAAASVQHAFVEMAQRQKGRDLPKMIAKYLSPAHRDDPGSGCPVAALGSAVAAEGPATQDAFSKGVEGWIALLERAIDPEDAQPDPERRAKAQRAMATMAGALMLARACPEGSPLRDEFLHALPVL